MRLSDRQREVVEAMRGGAELVRIADPIDGESYWLAHRRVSKTTVYALRRVGIITGIGRTVDYMTTVYELTKEGKSCA